MILDSREREIIAQTLRARFFMASRGDIVSLIAQQGERGIVEKSIVVEKEREREILEPLRQAIVQCIVRAYLNGTAAGDV